MTPYNLPVDVVNKINTIIFMQSTTFEGFNFIVKGILLFNLRYLKKMDLIFFKGGDATLT